MLNENECEICVCVSKGAQIFMRFSCMQPTNHVNCKLRVLVFSQEGNDEWLWMHIDQRNIFLGDFCFYLVRFKFYGQVGKLKKGEFAKKKTEDETFSYFCFCYSKK